VTDQTSQLEYIYKKPKFLMTCVFGIVFIIFGNLAGNALQFGVFVQKSLHPSCDETQECYNHAGVVGWAVFVLTMSAFINILTRDFTILINNIFAVCKVIFLVVVALMGIIYGSTHGDTCRQITWENKGAGGSFGDIALALFYAAYPYTGYEQPYYVLAEVKEPQRRFAKGTTYAMLAVLVLYPLVNVGYLCVVPYEGNGSLPVNMAITFFGRISGVSDDMRTVRAVSALLAIFIFGNIVAQTYTASRVKQEIGKEGIFGRFSLALATNNDALLARWLSPSTSRSPAINNLGGHLEQTPIFATFVHWLFEVILVLSFGIPFKPSKGYRYLTFLYTFTIVGVLGLLTVSGLLYLKVDSWIWPKIGRKWHEKARWKPWFDPIPCVVATLSLAFLLFAICVPPSARRPNDEPHWIMPLIGWTMPLVGVLWWSGLLSYLWKCRKTLVVKRLPLLDFDRRGQAVQLAEFVEVRAVPDVPDE
jgi:amino acid transporter